jgi:AraC family transcriptional regulator
MTTVSKEIKYELIYRVNRAIDYIRSNYADNLDLEKIARIACVSKYHFHRIFRSQTGETINKFVRRMRMEKSLQKLGLQKEKSVTEVALECGFSSSQNFAKAFKTYFGVSPKFIRGDSNRYNWYMTNNGSDNSSISPEKKAYPGTASSLYGDGDSFNLLIKKIAEQKKSMQVNVVEMPPFHLGYVRAIGADIDNFKMAAKKIFQWAHKRGMLNENSLFMGVPKSNPMLTDRDKYIFDFCVTIPAGIKKDEEINIQDIPGGKYAVCHWETKAEFSYILEAWMRLFMDWLPQSGYKQDFRQAYEIYYVNPEKHPQGHTVMDMCLAVKPA